jgi:RimJ/RimL family protein N-acetyltransferase
MLQLTSQQALELRSWFQPERRHLIGLHIINTGRGVCFVDRWPEPGLVLAAIGSLLSLSGDPGALHRKDLGMLAGSLLHCPAEFLPALQPVFPNLRSVDRVVFELDEPPSLPILPGVDLRRMDASHSAILEQLDPELHWIANTWGGLPGLAASGCAWAAFRDGKPVSLAATFLSADGIEDIGVVTNSAYRGQGLAPLCAAALCQDIQSRGRTASWTTSYDNPASIRAAEKLGFKLVGPDVLYIVGNAAPQGS